MILNNDNKEEAKRLFLKAINFSLDFKLQKELCRKSECSEILKDIIIESLPTKGESIDEILEEFNQKILNYSVNFSSPNFLGFPDSGNSVAAMCGAILSELIQQNLINQSFCSRALTFVEIEVINWLREVVGYKVNSIEDIFSIGGIVTHGGTHSNACAMLLARENHKKGTMQKGVSNPENFKVLIPEGISHYSIASSLMWCGCGNNIVEVKTQNNKMDLNDLKNKLCENKGNIMSVVAYAGDSRSMTIDNLNEVYKITKEFDNNIWVHADACHGFSLAFSEKLKYKISGLELYDSISIDPHKVLMTPYTISMLLVKKPSKMELISSKSDLIMNEKYAFGQITPFIGSKNANCLKLWFLIKNLGKEGIGQIIDRRIELAKYFYERLKSKKHYILLNNLEINSVIFIINPFDQNTDLNNINEFNKMIYSRIIKDMNFYVHQFPYKNSKGDIMYPLRYMSGNPNLTETIIDEFIKYLDRLILELKQTYVVK